MRVGNINDVITFQGTSVEELRQEFTASVDDYLAWCEEREEEPEKPYSGRFLLRIEPDLHRQAALVAARKGVSLNAWVASAVERALSLTPPSAGSAPSPDAGSGAPPPPAASCT